MGEQGESVTVRVPCSVAAEEGRAQRCPLRTRIERFPVPRVSLHTRWKPPHIKMRHDKRLHFLCWVPELHLPQLPIAQNSTKCVSNVPFLKQHMPILLFWLMHAVFSPVPQVMACTPVHQLPPGTRRQRHLQDTAISTGDFPSQFLRFYSD